MKRILSLILAALMFVSALAVSSSAATSDGYHGFDPCDCNDDGAVNMKDVLLLRRLVAGSAEAKDVNILAADCDGDGSVTMKDVLFLRKIVAGTQEAAGNNTAAKYKVNKVTVGGKNIARYDILIPSDADESMRYAASLFNDYLSDACGVTLNVIKDRAQAQGYVIEYAYEPEMFGGLGNDTSRVLGDEGYRVEVKEDGDILITCGRLRGAMYATYYFMEKFIGWRFLTDDVKYLYEADSVDIPLGFVDEEVPQFVYRGLNQVGVSKNGSGFSRLRLNALDAIGSGNAASDARYGGGTGNLYIHGHSYEYQEAVGRKLDEYKITDLDSDEAMQIFMTYGYNTQEHYDYVDAYNLVFSQPCLTSDDTFRHIMAFNYLLYKERTILGSMVPGINYTQFSVSPNDSTAFCTCENCKAVYTEEGSIAGTVFRMSNRASEAMKEIDPRVGVYTIAYWDARNPPIHTRPNDDVCVCFCFGGCNNHTYDHVEECAEAGGNPRYPFQIWDVEQQKPVRPDFNISNVYDVDCYNKWTELTNNIWVWYYACNFAYMISPCPNIFNIYNDYKYLASTGTQGIYTEGSSNGYTFEALRGYLAARMMWDPYMTEEEFEAYLDEYLMIWFGDGWENIKEYIYIQDKAGNLQGCFINNFDRPWNFYNKEYYGQQYDHILDLFNAAYDAAKTSEQRTRIERARIHAYFLGLSATYEARWVNGNSAEKAKYQEQYTYLWNYIKNTGYQVCSIGASGVGGCDNFPKNSGDVYDTMFWIMDGFYGDGR